MSKTTIAALVVGIPLLAFMAFVELPVVELPSSKETQTQLLLDNIAVAVTYYETAVTNITAKSEIEEQLLTAPEKALGRYIAEYAASSGSGHTCFEDSIAVDGMNGCVVIDAWGRPLVVEVLSVYRKFSAAVPYFRMGGQWVRVWSCGADGENAGGLKDDIRIRRNLTPCAMRSFFLYECDVPIRVLDVADYTSTSNLRKHINDIHYGGACSFGIKSRDRQVNFTFEPIWPDQPSKYSCSRYRIKANKQETTVEQVVNVSKGEFNRISCKEFLSKVCGKDIVEVEIDDLADLSDVDDMLTLLLASGSRHVQYTSISD